MRLVATRRIPEGATLARDVLTGRADAIPLLRAGTKLSDRFVDGLRKAGIHAVYIDDALGEGIDVAAPISDETRREATKAVSQAFDGLQTGRAPNGRLPDSALDELKRVAAMMAAEIETSSEVALALGDLSSADFYTHQHSVDVAALGLLLGQRLMRKHGWIDYMGRRTWRNTEPRLAKLGLGLLLHDIGKMTIPVEILNKPGKLEPAEWELMKTHPVAGVELLTSDLISPLVKVVVRSHHERWDGAGYPDGKKGEDINQLARIASVADVYDAVTSERVYARAQPPHVGVAVIRDEAGTAFDPLVAEVFRELVAPFPPGSEVKLSDGRRGVVASVPEHALDRPVVRVQLSRNGSGPGFDEIALVDYPELSVSALA